MHAYVVQSSSGMVKLDAMENPFRLPEGLQKQLGERLAAVAVNRYPGERTEGLRATLKAHVGMPPDADLMLGNGSDELIGLLALAFNLPGAAILAPEPGFVMYGMSAKLQGMTYLPVSLTPDFELDEAAMASAIATHQPALVYLANPNNPTANAWSPAAMRAIVAQVSAYGGWVVMDEAYQPFANFTWLEEMHAHPDANRQVILLRTLSKFGLAGVRLGYLVAHQDIVRELDKVRPPYNVSVLNTECALFAIEHASTFEAQAATIRQERERMSEALARLQGLRVYPSQANMVLIRLQGLGGGAAAVFEGLKAKGILVKNVSKMHPLLEDCLRFTVGTPEENDQLLQAMTDLLSA
jgi:histidinol-phosphate aminotransferase